MKKKIKSALLVVLTLALVSATAVAVTWALTNKQTNELVNVFTEGTIEAKLAEPWWDFEDKDGTDVTGDIEGSPYNYPMTSMGLTTGDDDPVKGETYAEKYSAGQFIPKNPMIYNTNVTGGASEYVAMKVDYKLRVPANSVYVKNDQNYEAYTESSDDYKQTTGGKSYYVYSIPYSTFTKIADVNVDYNGTSGTVPQFNTASATITGDPKWDAKSADNNVFYYDTIVAAQGNTEPLFQYVRINPSITDKTDGIGCDQVTLGTVKLIYKVTVPYGNGTKDLYLPDLPAFDIELKGYAVDATNMEGSTDNAKYTNAKAALDALIAANS